MPKKNSISKKSENTSLDYTNTGQIEVPKFLIDQIIGQDEGLKIIKKAALQRRNVLLIGEPGTGKSMLGQALAEGLPLTNSVDVLCLPNEQDENNPLVRIMPKGKGKALVSKLKLQNAASYKGQNILFFILLIISVITPWWIRKQYGDILAAASLIGSMIFLAAFVIFISLNRRMGGQKFKIPKLLIDSSEQKKAPFLDATGAHAGSLLGDCLHDPLQSFFSSNKVLVVKKIIGKNKTKIKEEKINLVEALLKKHKGELVNNGTYEAVHLNKNEMQLLGEKNNSVGEFEVLSVNRYKRNGTLIKLVTESGKELIVTPEHKVAIKTLFNKIKYIEAQNLRSWHNLVTLD